MKIVVGLGNPGREYAATRHNVGFMVVDELARRLSATDKRTRFRSEVIEAFDHGEKIVFVKPQTYMNLSGVAVREAARWYKAPAHEIMIVADDIDLPFGTLRMRAAGGSGGHNGLKSVFEAFGTQELPRLKVGVGRGSGNATRQVLTRFSPEETQLLPEIVGAAADCVLAWERSGMTEAMNRCNRRVESEAPAAADKPAPARDAVSGDVRSSPTAQPERPATTGAYNRARAWLRNRRVESESEHDDRRS